ncbi:MAG: protein kinase domain-containing protein, partial [Gammaproteobacteria bacterium]
MSAASHAARESALPPAIGRFVPRRLLGRGGQGTVYLAEDPELGREVALKTLRHLGQAREKLFGEARNVARLDHPGIVALFELGADAEPPYLVYQYAAGEP